MPSKTAILGIITLVFIAIVLIDAFGLWRYAITLDEPRVRDLVTDRYPGSDPRMEYMENCTICDPSGTCYVHWRPCWNISFLIEGEDGMVEETGDMVVDEGGEILEEEVSPCLDWWCDATPCRYTYTGQSGDTSLEYTNRDCQAPNITCDCTHERCRECWTSGDCLATVTGTSPTNMTYTFEVLGTGEYGIIDNRDFMCNITFEGDILFSNTTDIETCGLIVSSFARCIGGACDFVPEFAIIPY
jgi:hypothetical protein